MNSKFINCRSNPRPVVCRRHCRPIINHQSQSALTLIEILAVMGIMVLLAALTTGAAFALITHSHVKNTESLLQNLKNGLMAYSNNYYIFVPSDTLISSRPLWYALEHDGAYIEVSPKNKHHETGDDISDPLNTAQTLPFFIYRDAWQTELRYTCTGSFKKAVLQSAGRDKQFGTGDDITETAVKDLDQQ